MPKDRILNIQADELSKADRRIVDLLKLDRWREVIADARNSLYIDAPSAFDSEGYRTYASAVLDSLESEMEALASPRFKQTFCSQCGGTFGPGNAGISHCAEHAPTTPQAAQVLSDDEILRIAYPLRWQEIDDHEADIAENFGRSIEAVVLTKLQATPQAPNLADPAVQKRLAAQWGYVKQAEPTTITWDVQGRRMVNGQLALEHRQAAMPVTDEWIVNVYQTAMQQELRPQDRCGVFTVVRAALSSHPAPSPAVAVPDMDALIEDFEIAVIERHDTRNPESEFEHSIRDAALSVYDKARAALVTQQAQPAQQEGEQAK